MKRVVVIGAGAAGIAALRHLAAKPQLYTPVAYEQGDVVGGTWVYTDDTGHDEKGRYIYSSMYKNCTLNLAREIMQFSGFQFPDHLPSFLHHTEIRQYIEDFTDHHQLRQYIRFRTQVSDVTPIHDEEGGVKWEVKVRNACDPSADATTEMFDAVFVCNGACVFPLLPDIPGMDQFRGKIIHSKDYRVPEVFKDMRVVVVGSGSSAQDISTDVAKVAKEVVISHHNDRLNIPFLPNMRQTVAIDRVTSDSAFFEDGKQYEMDALILCTGYKKSFPFLSPKCHVKTEERGVYPLYKHILHTEYTSLAFIGIMEIIAAFPHCEVQVKFALSAWEGIQMLPSREDMEADIQRDLDWRLSIGFPAHRPHLLAGIARGYENKLAQLGKFKPLPENHYDGWELIVEFYLAGSLEYMTINLPKTADGLINTEKLATFREYVPKFRNGTMDNWKNTPFE